MPRPRFERLEPEKQDRILAVATTEFAEHGFEAASYNRIIEQAGLSKGAMYYYFDDKLDLYATVLRRVMDVFLTTCGPWPELDDLKDAEDFWAALEETYRLFVRAAVTHPEETAVARSMTQLRRIGDQGPIRQTMDQLRGWLERVVTRGQEVHAIRSDLPRSLLIGVSFAVGEAIDFWMLENVDKLDTTTDLPQRLVGLWRDVTQPKEQRP